MIKHPCYLGLWYHRGKTGITLWGHVRNVYDGKATIYIFDGSHQGNMIYMSVDNLEMWIDKKVLFRKGKEND